MTTKSEKKRTEIKRNIVFSSEQQKEILDAGIALEAEFYHQTISERYIAHIEQALFPENKEARYILAYLYKGDISVGEAMNNLFGYLAAGIDFRAKETNGRPLMEFAYNRLVRFENHFDLVVAKKESVYFFNHIKYMSERLDSYTKKETDIFKQQIYRDAAKSLRDLARGNDYREFFRGKDFISHIYLTFRNYWTIWQDWTYTYRLLGCLARIQTWSNNTEEKLELRNILMKITPEWTSF